LKILSVSLSDGGGGAEGIALNLTQGYRSAGFDARLLVAKKKTNFDWVDELPARTTQGSLNPLGPRFLSNEIIALDQAEGFEDMNFPFTWDILKYLGESKEAVLHLHNLHGGYFDLRALPYLTQNVPTIWTLHDSWALTGHCAHSFDCTNWTTGCGNCPDLGIYPAITKDNTQRNFEVKRNAFSASRLHVVTPSRWLLERIQQSPMARHFSSAQVITQGVDLDLFHPSDKAACREELGIPRDAVVLLCAANGLGRNPWKDFSTLTTAVASLPAAKSGKKIIVVALGETQPPHHLGNAEVYYPGFITPPTQLTKYYQAADLFLHFAKIDTFPTVVLEALACGLPVIASNVGGIPEQIQSAITWRSEGGVVNTTGATGVLIDKGNVGQAIAAISFLIDNATARVEIGSNAARTTQTKFSRKGMIKFYSALAKSLHSSEHAA